MGDGDFTTWELGRVATYYDFRGRRFRFAPSWRRVRQFAKEAVLHSVYSYQWCEHCGTSIRRWPPHRVADCVANQLLADA